MTGRSEEALILCIRNRNLFRGEKQKNLESPMGLDPMSSQTPGGNRSIDKIRVGLVTPHFHPKVLQTDITFLNVIVNCKRVADYKQECGWMDHVSQNNLRSKAHN